MNKPLRWYNSIAVKSCLIAFVATHIPLLGLIAVIVLEPQWLSPLGVFVAALMFTLVATAIVITVLWRMFSPLRAAADGLQSFMARGLAFQATAGSSDEIGRLMAVLVKALAHLDRGRSPLLYSGAMALDQAAAEVGLRQAGDRQWFVLLEIDQWQSLDGEGRFEEMLRIQKAVSESVERLLGHGEYSVPWGRGRLLASLACSGSDAVDRFEPLCGNILAGGAVYTATAVMEPQKSDTRARAAALQRLEQKLFAARMDGLQAAMA